MEERRQYERFMFPIPVRIETMELRRKKVLDLNTRTCLLPEHSFLH